MIKITDADARCFKQTKFMLSDGLTLDAADILPIDLTDESTIISQNVSINELGKELLRACGEGDVSEIRDLMSRGAPFTADWLGTSPLHLAAQNNYVEVCEILLRAGISRDARTKVDRTPLHIAAYEGHLEIVECLLKHGADYDCRDMLHMSPLHWAAQNAHADVVSLLIRYGASTTLTNKFDLTAVDLAAQIKRHDIVEIIRMGVREPMIAAQHLQLEMAADSNDAREVVDLTDNELNVTLQPGVLMEDVDSENSIDPDRINISQAVDIEPDAEPEPMEEDSSMSESIKYLQEHGITMLPHDDSNILSTVMETGHSVVLTEVGKQVLNSIKQSEPITVTQKPVQAVMTVPKLTQENAVTSLNMKKVITITPAEYLAMTSNGQLPNSFVKQNKLVQISKNNVKRIVMKKTKTVPVTAISNLSKVEKVRNGNEFEKIKKLLADALGQIEEYKVKIRKKEAEAEKYRQQLKLILENQ